MVLVGLKPGHLSTHDRAGILGKSRVCEFVFDQWAYRFGVKEETLSTANPTLKQFSTRLRFGAEHDHDQLARLQEALEDSFAGNPRLVVVRGPYPEELQGAETPWGKGVGVTTLLEATVDQARSSEDCEIWSFLGNHDLTNTDNFFRDRLIGGKILDEKQIWKGSSYFKVASTARRVRMFMHSSLTSIPGAVLAGAFFVWLITVAGLEWIAPIIDPRNGTRLDRLVEAFGQHPILLWAGGPVLLALWITFYLAQLDRDKAEREAWAELRTGRLREAYEDDQKQRLTGDPKKILPYVPSRKGFLLAVDDVDCMDNDSVSKMIQLFESMEESPKGYRACVVLGFNPQNPDLRRLAEKSQIPELLSKDSIDERDSWESVVATPLELERLVQILSRHFRSPRPRKLVQLIEAAYPGATRDTGRLLGFFEKVDHALSGSPGSLEALEDAELLDRFGRHVRQDAEEVNRIIGVISKKDGGTEALEFLKFMLAFQRHPTRVEHMERAMKKRNHEHLARCEAVLGDDPELLLVERVKNGDWYYRFTQPYYKRLLSSHWASWKRQEEAYCTDAFEILIDDNRWEEPEQALKSGPSKDAVEMLYNKGLYYYQYGGQSDAGYTLRYWGLDKGGALAKWRSLFFDSDASDEALWNLIYWDTTTFLNPYKGLSSKLAPKTFGAPELFLNAATAYWMIGRSEDANNVLADWTRVKARLTLSLDDDQLVRRLERDSARIDLLRAQILVHRGSGNDWKTATRGLCAAILDDPRVGADQRDQARFFAATVDHQSQYAVGNWLWPPLRFRPTRSTLEQLLAVGSAQSTDELVRLRALHMASSAMWDSRSGTAFDPRRAVANGISRDGASSRYVHPERYAPVREAIQSAISLLTEARKRPQLWRTRPQDAPPGGRAIEAEIVLWEAVFLGQRLLLLAMDVELEAKRYRGSLTRGAAEDKSDAYEIFAGSLAEKYGEFLDSGLFTRERRSSLARTVHHFSDKISESVRGPVNEIDFGEARRHLNALHISILEDAIDQMMDYFGRAETVYRWLGHRHGRAETRLQRGLMLFLTKAEQSQSWYESLERGLRDSDELGFHLSRLYSLIALATEDRHAGTLDRILDSVHHLKSAIELCSRLAPDFPTIVMGELNCRLGEVYHEWIPEVREATRDGVLQAMEKARSEYQACQEGTTYLTEEAALARMVDIHFRLASSLKVKALTLSPEEVLENNLADRAEEYCDWLISHVDDDVLAAEMRQTATIGYVIKADMIAHQGDFQTAVDNYQKAVDYFEEGNSGFYLLQTLVALCRTMLKERRSIDAEVREYLDKTVRATTPYERHFREDPANLSRPDKSVFARACDLLASVSRPEAAHRWLLNLFDVYQSLGLYGHAILLDERFSRVLSDSATDGKRREYEERLRKASQRIGIANRVGEGIKWREVTKILRGYFGDAREAATPQSGKKRDHLKTGVRLIADKEIADAIGVLESGRSLIDPGNPEDVDIELLEKMVEASWMADRPEEAAEAERQRQELENIANSRDFLLLAKAYTEKGWEARWALEAATAVENDSEFYVEAVDMLRRQPPDRR